MPFLFHSDSILRHLHDNIDSEIWKLRPERNGPWNLQISRRFSSSSRPNRVVNSLLVDRIDDNLLNWRFCTSLSDRETLQVEIIVTRMFVAQRSLSLDKQLSFHCQNSISESKENSCRKQNCCKTTNS